MSGTVESAHYPWLVAKDPRKEVTMVTSLYTFYYILNSHPYHS